MRIAIDIADSINLYVTEEAPWKQAATDPERAAAVLSVGVQASLLVAAILKPVLPGWAAKVERMLRRQTPLDFQNALEPVPVGTLIGPYENLADRLAPKKLEAIIEASREDLAPAPQLAEGAKVQEKSAAKVHELTAEVTIDAFAAIDLRVALVVGCEPVEGAAKLLRLELDLGPLGRRKVLSGIAKSYEPSQLLGKRVVVFANLAPRKMRFGTSEGMILAAGDDDAGIVVLELGDQALPGQRIS